MKQATHTHKKFTDWRAALAINQKKTVQVIALFILIYVALGLILDIYINGGFEPGQFNIVFNNIITFKIAPLATLTMCLVAIVSLFITYTLHDRIMLLGTNHHEITPETTRNLQEQQLYHIIEEMKIAAGLRYTPKVFLIDADYMNAFASGYSEKSAMIAVTSGLLNKLNRAELQAVIAHELSHIRHGDIKLSLTAIVLSNIMLIVIDFFFYNAIFGRRSREGGNRFLIIIMLLRYLLPLITILLILFLSRTREYMADAGSVELIRDNEPLARALIKINQDHQTNAQQYRNAYGKTNHEEIRRDAYIFDPFEAKINPVKSLTTLFSTHPSLDDRLRAIGYQTNMTQTNDKEIK